MRGSVALYPGRTNYRSHEYAQHQGYSRDRSAAIGLMFSVSLGASKELWDSRPSGSGWSWKDFAWDVAGATTGYALMLHRKGKGIRL